MSTAMVLVFEGMDVGCLVYSASSIRQRVMIDSLSSGPKPQSGTYLHSPGFPQYLYSI